MRPRTAGTADWRSAEGALLAHLDGQRLLDPVEVRRLGDECGLPLPLPFRGPPTAPLLRAAGERDALAIAAVGHAAALLAYRAIFPPAATKPTVRSLWRRWQRLIGQLQPPGTGLVLVLDRAVAGSIVASRDPDDPQVGHLAGLYVHPEHWGEGFGAGLLEAGLDRLRKGALPEATLWVLRENGRARSMYERRGWAPDGATRSVSTATEVDEIRYRITL